MQLDEIVYRAKFYTQILWGKELDCEIKINSRLKSTYGRVMIYRNNEKPKIEIAKRICDGDKFFIIDVLLHELTHWYLYSEKIEYRDGSKEFEDEIERIGATSTETSRDRKQGTSFIRNMYVYECPKCKLKLNITNYIDSGYGFNKGYECHRCGELMNSIGCGEIEELEFIPSRKIIEYEIKYLINKERILKQ